MITIRAATRADISEIDALLARSYPRLLKPDYLPSVLVTAIPRISRAQPALIASGTYYVVLDEDRIVGAGGWTAARPGGRDAEPGRANVRHVVTDDRMVRRGIGRALMTHVFATARRAGMTWMHCLSTRTAVPFYSAMGFAAIGETTISLGPGVDFPAVEMRRDLADIK
jgi:N-acetylglutamate synthase-like GNAT family acetyltransferase